MRVLVTGGAGYIGSHTVRYLLEAGRSVAVVDNLKHGYAHNVPEGLLHRIDVAETDVLAEIMRGCDAVVHFAALIGVGESTKLPELHFRNNLAGSISVVEAMVRAGVSKIVFSSTAAVYGDTSLDPIPESAPIAPANPYGETKAMVERMLDWMDSRRGIRSVRLRYFNACGAEPRFGIGEEHEPETHLIPLLFRAIESGNPMTVFGDDYPTPDGTCIRDYIHVSDLAAAHLAALDHLEKGGGTRAYNVGTGRGHSVFEVIRAVEEATGRKVPYVVGPRRDGDPPRLVADATRLRADLEWSPRYTDLRETVRTAWDFERLRLARRAT
ncbi:MAG: UDP-glucose 4-epimerase GalE [Bryobacteraceae bacterium]|nr:UDP-glucose 4-epimerase GalE [Bryobacteraceae bacterium]